MDAKGFGVTNRQLENLFQNNVVYLSQNFVGVFRQTRNENSWMR